MLCLDTVHLAMVYEYATWHKRTEGSTFLRMIMRKFLVRGQGLPANTWGEPFDGKVFRPLSAEEDPQWCGVRKGITGTMNAKRIYKPSHSAMWIVVEVCDICLSTFNRCLPLPLTEEIYRAQIRSQGMSRARCERVRQKLKEDAPFVHRVEFIEALAALTSLFKEEVSMCSGQSSIK